MSLFRLTALKTAFTSKLRADSIRADWNLYTDQECGGIVELSGLTFDKSLF